MRPLVHRRYINEEWKEITVFRWAQFSWNICVFVARGLDLYSIKIFYHQAPRYPGEPLFISLFVYWLRAHYTLEWEDRKRPGIRERNFEKRFICRRNEFDDFEREWPTTGGWPAVLLFRLCSAQTVERTRAKKMVRESRVAENDGIRLLTASSTPNLTYSPRRKTHGAHRRPETDDGPLE